jgi:hypothetical protein
MITTTTVILILVMLLPTPQVSDAELQAFEKFCRGLWRAIVITLKLTALTIALIVAFLEFGSDTVILTLGYVLFGIIGLRIFLWATEFILPDRLHNFLSAKSDPDYLLKLVF